MDVHGDVLPRSILAEGFVLDRRRVPLLGPQGIFKPGIMAEAALSITTIPGGPYDDTMGSGGALRYRYRGTDPAHPDNRGLRRAMQEQLPLVWFYRVQPRSTRIRAGPDRLSTDRLAMAADAILGGAVAGGWPSRRLTLVGASALVRCASSRR